MNRSVRGGRRDYGFSGDFVVYDGENAAPLPKKEFELLFKIGSNPGRAFTREGRIDELWGPDLEGTERTLDVHMNRLRERFPEDGYGFKLTAVRGLGLATTKKNREAARRPYRGAQRRRGAAFAVELQGAKDLTSR